MSKQLLSGPPADAKTTNRNRSRCAECQATRFGDGSDDFHDAVSHVTKPSAKDDVVPGASWEEGRLNEYSSVIFI
jgi:hypothetical protein